MTDFADGIESEAGLSAAHEASGTSAAHRDDAGAGDAARAATGGVGAVGLGAGGVRAGDARDGTVLWHRHAAGADHGRGGDLRGTHHPAAAVSVTGADQGATMAATAEPRLEGWKLRCARRHVCAAPCAACAALPPAAPTMGSETRTTRHHHTNCAIHGTLVDGKLRDCTCTATPAPAADGEAEFSICVWCSVRVEWAANADRALAESKLREHSARCPKHPAVQELLALRARPALPADVPLALSILEKILGGLGYARTARNAEKQDAQYDELARALGVGFERTKIHPFPADIVLALAAALRATPLPADAERDAREAAWFRWLRDNPQAAAFTAVNVAKWVPAGPDLGATMASGTVVGEMEDAKNPDYRYHIAASSLPADVQEVVAQVTVTAKWMRGRIITSTDLPSLCVSGDEFADGIDTLLAHLTREAR